MAIGRVKWFNNEKKFGFIITDNREVFVHFSAILKEGYKTLKKGQAVEFDLVMTPKGEKAMNVKELPDPESTAKKNHKKQIMFYPRHFEIRGSNSAA